MTRQCWFGCGVVLSLATLALADDPAGDLKAKFGVAGIEPKPADGDAPLPEAFPPATAPGAIEVKRYPAYRSAVARNPKATSLSGDLLFFPLFNHISKREIAMTAPVINSYPRAMIATPGSTAPMEMEFLYRTPKQGEAGQGVGVVEVEDRPEGRFACLGIQGRMNDARLREGLDALRAWLAGHRQEWAEDEDREPRRLGYHGPMTPVDRKLWEVQLPIRPARPEENPTPREAK